MPTFLDDLDQLPPAIARLERQQSQHSDIAKTAIMNNYPPSDNASTTSEPSVISDGPDSIKDFAMEKPKPAEAKLAAPSNHRAMLAGAALTDTPATTAPSSPQIGAKRQDTAGEGARRRPTTLDIPGLTKSRVSPDGRIAQRDVGSKLVIVMVGLPARGKSYITKKICRYLNWLQHDTKIFNVGERRRVIAQSSYFPLPRPVSASASSVPFRTRPKNPSRATIDTASLNGVLKETIMSRTPTSAKILVNGHTPSSDPLGGLLPPSAMGESDGKTDSSESSENEDPNKPTLMKVDHPEDSMQDSERATSPGLMEQSAEFFDPDNQSASQLREQLAMETLDELLDYILEKGGSVGIFDATNSTLARRQAIMTKVRERAGPELNVLFLESLCLDDNILEANKRLKLSGPDYKDQDPIKALQDFEKRIALYEKNYVRIGDYEERNNMPYIQMIDVGRKVITHQIRGFLSAQTVYYLLNFNLAPRQIWITRHGESMDNLSGKIGGDSTLSSTGLKYAADLTTFINAQRREWDIRQADRAKQTHFPPLPGDASPPNPAYGGGSQPPSSSSTTNDPTSSSSSSAPEQSFCVWTSMLHRSIQTAQFFPEDDYEIKQMRMLDELNAGSYEGLSYHDIRTSHPQEYKLRQQDKLHYRYPGAGGEGYLDVINRLRAVIVEVERMCDHVLLVGHRSIARVLLAYFLGLGREVVAELEVPLGWVYCLEPRPYGVDFRAWRWKGVDGGVDGSVNGLGHANGEVNGRVNGHHSQHEEDERNPASNYPDGESAFELIPGYQLRKSEVQTVC